MRRLLFAFIFISLVGLSFAEEKIVKGIIVEGNRIIQTQAILNKISTKAGEPFDYEKISMDIKKIYNMGFFYDVNAEEVIKDGNFYLKFNLKEKTYIKEIIFKGTDNVSEDDLRTQMSTKRYSFYDERKIFLDIEKLKKYYQDKGYYFVKISHKIEPMKDNPKDNQLVITIEEGEKIKIKEIRINGVSNFTPKKIKKEMETKEKWFLSWLTGSGIYKADELKDDMERIKEFYGNEGFISAKVLGHKVYLNEEKDGLIVEIDISEGKRFFLEDVKIEGDAKPYEQEIIPRLKQKKGDVFKRANIRDDITYIGDFMGDKGYAYANVEPQLDINEENAKINLAYNVSKGSIVYINRITIEGNTKTRDYVIRREINLDEGDLYSSSKLRKSRNKINRLGFFEEVNFVPNRVDYLKPEGKEEDLMDLLVRVKERPTGYLTFGLGYSSVDQFMASIQISQNNLFGRGQRLSATAQTSSKSQSYDISFFEPYLLGSRFSGGASLFNIKREYTDYTKDSSGFGLKSGYRFNEDWSSSIGYRYESAIVTNVSDFASQIIKDQVGRTITSSIYGSIMYDTRNDAFYPTEGATFTYSLELAGGVLGGDNKYIKSSVDSAKYFLLPWEHTISIHGQYGNVWAYGGKRIPIYEKFFLGGMYSLRGFVTRSIGPKDPVTGDVLGGTKMILGNVEYIFPLIKEAGVRMVIFFDIGNSFEDNIFPREYKYSTGAGIRWYSPMGPLRLEWGKNLNPKDGEVSGKWEFSIGTVF